MVEFKHSRWVLLGAVLLFLVGGLRLVTLHESRFVGGVIVDDALYFLKPARHFVEGHGFSFDGVYRSNGVQTLWALMTIAVAWSVPDDFTAMRALCLLSGLMWLAAGVLLYRGLAESSRRFATLVACGWLMAGFTDRIAFQGMENGLAGLLFAALVVYGVRLGSAVRERPPHLRLLGFLVALFTLCRTEYGLLAVFLFFWVLLGRIDSPGRSGRNWRAAWQLTWPGLVIVGGALVVSQLYFGSFLPISGRVKTFYEDAWGRSTVHGPVFENLAWHFKHIRHLALGPLSSNVSESIDWLTGFRVGEAVLRRWLLIAYVLGIGYRFCRWVRRRDARPHGARFSYGCVLAGFVAVHLSMMALLLPHFTAYGTWYFSAEILVAWMIVVWALVGFLDLVGGLSRRVFSTSPATGFTIGLVLPLFLVLVSIPRALADPPQYSTARCMARAGRWLQETLPPGQRIGSLSAGLVSTFAPGHRVYNLDGLIANVEYFEQYLRRDRILEFIDREQIGYFSDYHELSRLEHGIRFCGLIPYSRLRILEWWRLDGDLGYAIWRILPSSGIESTTSPRVRDRLAELRFTAEVRGGKFTVVEPDELRDVLASDPDRCVLASIPLLPSQQVRHILATPAELAATDLSVTDVPAEREVSVRYGGAIELYGVGLPTAPVRRGARIVVSTYWQRLHEEVEGDFKLVFRLVTPERVLVERRHEFGYGTRPLSAWRRNQAVVEDISVEIPATATPGRHAVTLELIDAAGETVGSDLADPTLRLGYVEVTR